MKKLLIVLLLVPMLSYAGGAEDLNAIGEAAADQVGNGDVSSVKDYDVKSFDIKTEQKQLLLDFIDNGVCSGITRSRGTEKTLKRFQNINSSWNNEPSETQKMTDALATLKKNDNLSAILSVGWDGQENDSGEEAISCDMHLFRLFTKDGKTISIFYSLTD